MNGVTTFRVVEPSTPAELYARLMEAANSDTRRATFKAIITDDPCSDPDVVHTFQVTIDGIQLSEPVAFDVTDTDNNYLQLLVDRRENEPTEFVIYS